MGGSVRYAYDLMLAQSRRGHNVYSLVCGDTLFHTKRARIKYVGNSDNIEVYKITNPLTPTMIYGVRNPESQYKDILIDANQISNFIVKNKIEIFHMHTMMGLHRSIVELIKGLNVKIVYTTHDYHGICPNYNMLSPDGKLCLKRNGEKCKLCNIDSPSELSLRLANSNLYQALKKTRYGGLIKKLITFPSAFKSKAEVDQSNVESAQYYDKLLNYYKAYFSLIDNFHYNSQQSKEIFQKILPNSKGKAIPVVTAAISDNRKRLKVNPIISFGYVGNVLEYKGFDLLKSVLTELYEEGYKNFKLLVYASGLIGKDRQCSNIEYLPPYEYSHLSHILEKIDCMVVPSKWFETFSLITLEALSYGIPVIASDRVGARTHIESIAPDFIFRNAAELKNILKEILHSKGETLSDVNEKLMNSEWKYGFESHVDEIFDLYSVNFRK